MNLWMAYIPRRVKLVNLWYCKLHVGKGLAVLVQEMHSTLYPCIFNLLLFTPSSSSLTRGYNGDTLTYSFKLFQYLSFHCRTDLIHQNIRWQINYRHVVSKMQPTVYIHVWVVENSILQIPKNMQFSPKFGSQNLESGMILPPNTLNQGERSCEKLCKTNKTMHKGVIFFHLQITNWRLGQNFQWRLTALMHASQWYLIKVIDWKSGWKLITKITLETHF
jgi:hypothetical protein